MTNRLRDERSHGSPRTAHDTTLDVFERDWTPMERASQRSERTTTVPFTGLSRRILSTLLQLRFVRFNRVQLGFVEQPAEYERFLATVVGARVRSTRGPIGIFGAGEHTRVLLRALPDLHQRVSCLLDNNQTLWRTQRFGCTVLPPEEAVRHCSVVVLSTAVFQESQRHHLEVLRFQGQIIAVDDVVPPAWFLAEGVC